MTLYADFIEDTFSRVLGDAINIGLKNLRNEQQSSLEGLIKSATVQVYDVNRTPVLTATNLALTPQDDAQSLWTASYLLRTGTGYTLTLPNYYSLLFQVELNDLTQKNWQQTLLLQGKPS